MNAEDRSGYAEQLHGLITGTEDIKGFLDGMTGFAADMMTRAAGARIECGVTLRQRKRSALIAGSSDDAILLDGIGQRLGQGPGEAALHTLAPVLPDDVATDPRWPPYCSTVAAMGCRSVLGVPLELGPDAAAVLNFLLPPPRCSARPRSRTQRSLLTWQGTPWVWRCGSQPPTSSPKTVKPSRKAGLQLTLPAASSWPRTAAPRCRLSKPSAGIPVPETRNKLHTLARQVVTGLSGTEEIATNFED
jgi:hypothetical protein